MELGQHEYMQVTITQSVAPGAGFIPGSGLFWAHWAQAGSWKSKAISTLVLPFSKTVPEVGRLCQSGAAAGHVGLAHTAVRAGCRGSDVLRSGSRD